VSIDEAILRQLRARIARGAGTDAPHGHQPEAPTGIVVVPPPRLTAASADPVAPFTTAWESLGGVVHHAHSAADAISIVAAICRSAGAEQTLSWREPDLGVPGIVDGLRRLGIESDYGWLPPDRSERAARLAELERIKVGVTGASGAIGESGTVVLVSGPGRPRLASLLPPIHVTLLHVSRMHASLPDFLAAEPTIADGGSNLVLITGPSRTADIEMTLTRGVHGPGHVHAVLVHSA
jgi:L-lactate dehydrogenase complex protein LldG